MKESSQQNIEKKNMHVNWHNQKAFQLLRSMLKLNMSHTFQLEGIDGGLAATSPLLYAHVSWVEYFRESTQFLAMGGWRTPLRSPFSAPARVGRSKPSHRVRRPRCHEKWNPWNPFSMEKFVKNEGF